MGLTPGRLPVVADLMNRLLDRGYTQATGAVIQAITNGSTSGLLAQRLNELDAEAARLAANGERLMPDNPVVRALLADFDTAMQANEALINSASGAVQMSGLNAAGPVTQQQALPGLSPAQVRALGVAWNVPDPEAVAQVVNYASTEGWRTMLARYSDDAVQAAIKTAVRGMVEGWGPIRMANELRGIVQTIPAYQANTLMRTLQLTSFRDAQVVHRVSNAAILDYQIRIAALDGRTCFPAGTLVQTDLGFKPIQKITVGDKVLTGKGRYRRVTATMRRVFVGKFISLKTRSCTLITTYNHPVLIRRDGNCHWITAENIKSGDLVFVSRQYSLNHGNFGRINSAVEGSIGDTNHGKALADQACCFAPIRIGASVPVNAVYFQRDIEAGQEEINGIAVYCGLLLKWFTKSLKAAANNAFRFCLALIAAVASGATKLLVRHGGHDAKISTTCQAGFYYRWAATQFRTVVNLAAMCSKDLAATFTCHMPSINRLALIATNCVAVRIGQGHGERLTADGADFGYRMGTMLTRGGTIPRIALGDLRGPKNEILTADFAGKGDALALSNTATSAATELPVVLILGKMGVPHIEGFAADDAGSFCHEDIISSEASLIKGKVEVYNLEVEEDHTYTANGMIVHNCLSCVALHGKRYPIDARIDDHWGGRCTSINVLKGEEPPPELQSGEAWFNSLSEDQQRAQMGNAMYEAWQAGAIRLSDIPKTTTDPVFGPMIQAASLKGLLGQDAQDYYRSPS